MKTKTMIKSAALMGALALALTAAEAQEKPESVTFIDNARIFDGRSEKLTTPMSVLIEGNVIARIAPRIDAPAGATVIDAGGRTMTPGFIDAHYHLMIQLSPVLAIGADEYYHAFNAVPMARSTLERGFTTVRDVSGNTFSLKRAIDGGLIEGPRIYPSGPMISQTSGHADARMATERSPAQGGRYSPLMDLGYNAVADGVPEVLKSTRENLRRGASQIKIAVGGGTGTESDPLDVAEFTPEEIQAAVQAASDWNTYVTAHVYTVNGIRRAIDNGVKCIEHGQLMDEATMRLMKDKGIWWSPQVIIYTFIPKGYTAAQKRKHEQAFDGLDAAFRTAKKIGFDRIAFGTDIVLDPDKFKAASEEFVHRTKWFTPAEILRQATSTNAQLLAMSGPRNPYPGKLGVIEEGAIADLLLINGDPLQDISILVDYRKNIALIMKGGKIFKNTTK